MNDTTLQTQSHRFAPGIEVNTLMIDGAPYFVAKDVCIALGYANGRAALTAHVDAVDRNSVVIRDGTPGSPTPTVISEAGLYALIFGSRLPAAKDFKRWVTGTVLPALRQGAVYVVGQEKVDLANMNEAQARAHIDNLRQIVTDAEAVRWLKSREEKDARRSGFKLLKGSRTSVKGRRAAAVRATSRTRAKV